MSPNDTHTADQTDALLSHANTSVAEDTDLGEAAGPSGETKEEKFRRVAKPRTLKVLKDLQVLGNTSSTGNYSYTPEQVDIIFNAIQAELDKTRAMFSPAKKTKAEVTLDF